MHLLKQYSWLLLLAVIICIVFVIWIKDPEGETAIRPLEKDADPAEDLLQQDAGPDGNTGENPADNSKVVVDIKGEVRDPGVYELVADSRVEQAIEAAGGLTEKAEGRSINLAQRITDEQVIYVAGVGEAETLVQTAGSSDSPDKININQADAEELTELNGVGEAKAQAIIAFREENGPFTSIDQLTEVPGIGEKSLENMKDQISL
ncbi:competence protein ComEA [Terribacillus halophilus]|uniref:Competence protein ComEA n=1 Tax=Terribacillus halophilus TaxID=361279 RepID=A0A1G6SP62_9BACI|nr:ComEA family DNA-binding protein [Terribacillus halophilus]SDD18454.1 competence protein ComEA [Terribacillus halophilus]